MGEGRRGLGFREFREFREFRGFRKFREFRGDFREFRGFREFREFRVKCFASRFRNLGLTFRSGLCNCKWFRDLGLFKGFKGLGPFRGLGIIVMGLGSIGFRVIQGLGGLGVEGFGPWGVQGCGFRVCQGVAFVKLWGSVVGGVVLGLLP